jgi:hypothetical protein
LRFRLLARLSIGRSLGQWLIGGFIAALGISLLATATIATVHDLQLRSSAVQTSATVVATRVTIGAKGRPLHSYLVKFTALDGVPYADWVGGLPSTTAMGDSVTVDYLPDHPDTAKTPFAVSRWWAALAIEMPIGLFLLWMAWVCWRRPMRSSRM